MPLISVGAGYNNIVGSNFEPEVFRSEALYYFQNTSTVEAITTSIDGSSIGEIHTTIHIPKQPQVTVQDYVRGVDIQPQALTDEETVMTVDQAKVYSFQIDDIVAKQSHVNYEQLAAESATYELKDSYDAAVLSYISGQVNSANVVGASSSEKTIGYGASNDYTPLDALAYLGQLLDENNVPSEGRFAVFSPAFHTALIRETGKLIEVQVTGDGTSPIRNGMVGDLHGFTLFKTNNAIVNANSKPVLLVGHAGATYTSSNFLNNEVLRMERQFGTLHRGLHVYGHKVVRDTSLAQMHMTIGDV